MSKTKNNYPEEVWSELRLLAKDWYYQSRKWVIPTRVFIILPIIGYVFASISPVPDKIIRFIIWLIFSAFCMSKMYGRKVQIDGFLDGWTRANKTKEKVKKDVISENNNKLLLNSDKSTFKN